MDFLFLFFSPFLQSEWITLYVLSDLKLFNFYLESGTWSSFSKSGVDRVQRSFGRVVEDIQLSEIRRVVNGD